MSICGGFLRSSEQVCMGVETFDTGSKADPLVAYASASTLQEFVLLKTVSGSKGGPEIAPNLNFRVATKHCAVVTVASELLDSTRRSLATNEDCDTT
jgi:hypothetical protein